MLSGDSNVIEKDLAGLIAADRDDIGVQQETST